MLFRKARRHFLPFYMFNGFL
ncbi:hypothetical protein KR026_007439 [Drosophila bipectinata]|nr:hypothetical protein KR026_007439 [Drosophila bipectinata]KAH8248551.1 hypothetical protein KR032_000761 [Drosophila birchii]KAH8255107.1 hypothetical protein KR038_001083 [Drosophila bunnanda]KAH8283024.1 hypothetical protein KR054_011594 [Drosophila jambulina]KAH8333103.1 hypothetical protein KR074_005715 [Drosophila pseudoananassae]KAH8341553.1 hypothetical protein KR059_009939 [Drosophila kikkawai]KAH8367791.1 hypothetical protein KR084_002878 [Drosophila pseudotakahashii]KAH8410646.1